MTTKRILIFLAFTFGITWGADLVFYLTIGKHDLPMAGLLSNYIFTLWAPAMANVATRLITKEGWGHLMLRPNFRRGWRYYLAAWLLPSLAIVLGAAIFYLFFPQFFDPDFSELRRQSTVPWAATINSWNLMLIFALQMMIFFVPVFALVSFGEEFGWRGYLLPKLVERLGSAQRASASADVPAQANGFDSAAARKAALLVGVIWAVWHWPGRLLFTEMSIVQLLTDLVPMCSLSILLAWVTLRSGSMWPAAVGHSTHNQILSLPNYSVKGPFNAMLGPTPSGLISAIAYLALALVLWFHPRVFGRAKQPASSEDPRAKKYSTLV